MLPSNHERFYQMKKAFLSLTLLFSLGFSGCCSVPQEARDQPKDNVIVSDAFVALMLQDKTTRKQEQAFIMANRKAWHAQNFALNDVPLPEDLQTGDDSKLLQILNSDPKIRAAIADVNSAITPRGE